MGEGVVGVRDFQRSRVYAAEKVVEPLVRYPNIEQCQSFADHVLDRLGHKRITVVAGHPNQVRARGSAYKISLPLDWAMNDYIILHELAHTIISRKYGGRVAGHGEQWTSCLIGLVERFMGATQASALMDSFARVGIAYDDECHDAVLLGGGSC